MLQDTERWLEENTVSCPVGRVSKMACRMLRKRKNMQEYLGPSGRDRSWGFHAKKRPSPELMPWECGRCPGFDELFAAKKKKGGAMEEKETKRCTLCGEEKPLEGFYRDRHTRDGRTTRCIRCIKQARKLRSAGRSVLVSFKGHEDLFEALSRSASQGFRTIEQEVLFLISRQLQEVSGRVEVTLEEPA